MFVSNNTTLPNDISGHTVLSGHRNTVFESLEELENGDELIIYYDEERYIYIYN